LEEWILARYETMKRDLMDILACPTCKGDLTLTVDLENETEIISGKLTCSTCAVDYPIEEGIPNLLPKNTK
jgi:uncharacterized protein YbaR (Trm112 family)